MAGAGAIGIGNAGQRFVLILLACLPPIFRLIRTDLQQPACRRLRRLDTRSLKVQS